MVSSQVCAERPGNPSRTTFEGEIDKHPSVDGPFVRESQTNSAFGLWDCVVPSRERVA